VVPSLVLSALSTLQVAHPTSTSIPFHNPDLNSNLYLLPSITKINQSLSIVAMTPCKTAAVDKAPKAKKAPAIKKSDDKIVKRPARLSQVPQRPAQCHAKGW
jgi:hypothetical protein